MSTTAIEKPVAKKGDIRSYIQSDVVKKQIALVLPKHLTADVMARVVCTAILKTPKLAECRIESLLQSIMLLSQFGLLPDGRSAHLIPYGNICQAIVDYKGYIARASENGLKNISYDIVCFNDKFTWKRGVSGLQFEHEPDWRNPSRGEMFAAYCVWTNTNGQFEGEIMTRLEIDGIRKRSKASGSGPWVTDYNEMAKKTVVRRSAKRWPLDAKFKDAIEAGELKSAATIEIEDLPPLPVVEDAPSAIEAPAEVVAEKTGAETPAQEAKRMVLEAVVPLEMFVAEVTARNIAKDADSWPDYNAVPEAVWETLHAQPKTLANLIKKFGTKK